MCEEESDYPSESELVEDLCQAMDQVTELELALLQAKTRVSYFKRRLRTIQLQSMKDKYGPLAPQVLAEHSSEEVDDKRMGRDNGPATVVALVPSVPKPAPPAGRARGASAALTPPPDKRRACWNEERGLNPTYRHTRGMDGLECRLPEGRKKPRRAPAPGNEGGGTGAGEAVAAAIAEADGGPGGGEGTPPAVAAADGSAGQGEPGE